MKILVADDDPVTLHMVVYRLRQWGHEVISCTDGDSALKLLEGGLIPNVVILDWMMPGINGPELCQKIRARTDCLYVYIVLLTGKNNPEDLIVGLDAGADGQFFGTLDRIPSLLQHTIRKIQTTNGFIHR